MSVLRGRVGGGGHGDQGGGARSGGSASAAASDEPWTRSWRLQRPTRTGAKTKTTFIFTDAIPLPIFASRGGAVSPPRGGHAEEVVLGEGACRRRRLCWRRRRNNS